MDFLPVCEPLLDGNELAYVTEAVRTGWISSSGSYVGAFEQAFAPTAACAYDSIVANGRYKFTSREMVLTGLPRHDALLRKAQARKAGRTIRVPHVAGTPAAD